MDKVINTPKLLTRSHFIGFLIVTFVSIITATFLNNSKFFLKKDAYVFHINLDLINESFEKKILPALLIQQSFSQILQVSVIESISIPDNNLSKSFNFMILGKKNNTSDYIYNKFYNDISMGGNLYESFFLNKGFDVNIIRHTSKQDKTYYRLISGETESKTLKIFEDYFNFANDYLKNKALNELNSARSLNENFLNYTKVAASDELINKLTSEWDKINSFIDKNYEGDIDILTLDQASFRLKKIGNYQKTGMILPYIYVFSFFALSYITFLIFRRKL